MPTCPSCGSSNVYPSRLETVGERVRRFLTRKRPQRCHACDWRGWSLSGWDTVGRSRGFEHPPGVRQSASLSLEELDDLDPAPTTDAPPRDDKRTGDDLV